jgi:hypothetical protein
MKQGISFKWEKAKSGYHDEERSGVACKHAGFILYGCAMLEMVDDQAGSVFLFPKTGPSGLRTPVRGLAGTRVLCDLANMQPTAEEAKLFADRWGLLDDRPELEVSELYRVSAEVWAYLHLLSAGRWDELDRLTKDRAIDGARCHFGRIRPEPKSLRHYCFLKLMELVNRRECVRRCACGRFFTGKGNKISCSDKCRKSLSKARVKHPDQPDPAEMGRIEGLWRDRHDITISPVLRRAFVALSEIASPMSNLEQIGQAIVNGAEFLGLIADWIAPSGFNDMRMFPSAYSLRTAPRSGPV